jgi:hypothetical protein
MRCTRERYLRTSVLSWQPANNRRTLQVTGGTKSVPCPACAERILTATNSQSLGIRSGGNLVDRPRLTALSSPDEAIADDARAQRPRPYQRCPMRQPPGDARPVCLPAGGDRSQPRADRLGHRPLRTRVRSRQAVGGATGRPALHVERGRCRLPGPGTAGPGDVRDQPGQVPRRPRRRNRATRLPRRPRRQLPEHHARHQLGQRG